MKGKENEKQNRRELSYPATHRRGRNGPNLSAAADDDTVADEVVMVTNGTTVVEKEKTVELVFGGRESITVKSPVSSESRDMVLVQESSTGRVPASRFVVVGVLWGMRFDIGIGVWGGVGAILTLWSCRVPRAEWLRIRLLLSRHK